MAATTPNNGSRTTTLATEHALATITTEGVYQLEGGAAPDLTAVSKTSLVVLTTIDGGTTNFGHILAAGS